MLSFKNSFSITIFATLYLTANAQTVGLTMGNADVNDFGAATYTIPIKVSPGTNNLEPEISIHYNSQRGNGLVGYGWNLSGLSVIARDNKDIYHDGVVAPADITQGTPFVLDGLRLSLKTGSYGAAGATYGLEAENFSIVTSNGSVAGCTGCPQSFTVKTKTGLTLEYGNTADSRVVATNGTTPVMWRINKMSDNNGNYIEYKYLNTDGQSRIDEINYTGNVMNNILPYNKIKFNYVIRTDQNISYAFGSGIAGTPLNNKYLLDNIAITGEGGIAVKTYQCAYTFNGRYSLLTSVTEKGSDGVALNPTTFTYGPSNEFSLTSSYDVNTLPSDPNTELYFGDFDGDGMKDLFIAYYYGGSIPKVFYKYEVYKNNSGVFNDLMTSGSLPTVENSIPIYAGFNTGDFNGDGRTDIVMFKKTKSANSATADKISSIRIFYPNLNWSVFTITDYAINSSILFPESDAIIGDFDGDGRSDIITRISASTLNLHLIGKNEFNYTLQDNANAWGIPQLCLYSPKITDIDGDGKNELSDELGDVYQVIKNGTGYQPVLLTFLQQQFGSADINRFGDFNGDGKMDVLVGDYNSAVLDVAYSTGNSYVHTNLYLSPTGGYLKDYQTLKIGDFNGDGKSDILHYYKQSNSTIIGIDVYLSNGIGFTKYNVYSGESPTRENLYVYTVADLNGEGYDVLMCMDNLNLVIFNFQIPGQYRLLQSITDGFGKISTFQFDLLRQVPVVSTVYPLSDVMPSKYIVSNFNQSIGEDIYKNVSMSYSLQKYHKQGLGFLGFSQIIETDNITNLKTVKDNTFTGAPFYLKILNQISLIDGNGVLKANKIYTTVPVDLTPAMTINKRVLLKTTQVSELDINGATTTTSTTIDDNTGNTTKTIVNKNNVEITTTDNSNFCTACGTSVPSPPQNITETISRTGSPANFVNSMVYVYDSKGRVTRKTDFSTTAKPVVNDRTYDNFGNMLTDKISSGADSRLAVYTYTSNGRMIASYKNPLGEITMINSYDARWAAPTKTSDFTGRHKVIYVYDALGRVISETPSIAVGQSPYAVTKTYVWSSLANSKYQVTTTTTGLVPTIEYYDALDRLVRTERTVNGNLKFEEKTFDSKGDVVTEKTNNANGGVIITNKTYDLFHRLTGSSTPVKNESISITLSPSGGNLKTVNTTTGQPVKITTIDATGKIILLQENGGNNVATDIYTYHANGGLIKVTQNGVDVAACAYDANGNQTQLTDKDAGINNYEYNGLGLLTKQTDARNNITELSYESTSDRITQKKLTDAGNANSITTNTYTYTPYGTANGADKLSKISSTSGITEEYSYDAFDRANSLKKTFEGNNYITTVDYGNFNRINWILYPAAPSQVAFKAVYTYSADGYVTKIDGINNGITKTLFSALASNYNAFDEIKQYTLGNGLGSTATYNDFGLPTLFYTWKIFNPSIQNLSMQYYDATKNFNLATRTDNVISPQKPAALTETFDYDVYDRIISTQLGTAVPKLTAYSAIGNITNKYDAGSEYIYGDPAHVHAVTAIKSKVYNGPGLTDPLTEPCDISREQQDITYTGFNQPWMITQSSAPLPDALISTKQLTYTYDINNQRIKAIYKEGGAIKYTRYYFDNMEYEKDGSGNIVRQVHYINGPTGLIAMLVRETGSTDKYFIPYKDHTSSIVTVTDEAGVKVAEQSFDAWGRQRNPYNWTYNGFTPIGTGTTKWLYRGYTGHEHLPQFDLINMNGRIYDPIIGRMLSPDNFVHDAFQTQHFNRYSYVWNNPLKFTDPNGQDGWADYEEDWGREDRDDNRDDDYDENVPEGYHVQDGVLYQDVFEELDGTVYHNIEVGSWNGDNGEDGRSWSDFQQEPAEERDFVLGEERDDRDEREKKSIRSDEIDYNHSFLEIDFVKIIFKVSYTIDKDDDIEVEDVTSTFEGIDPPYHWEPKPWVKGKSDADYTKDGRVIVKAGGTLHTGLGQYGYSKYIEGTFTIDKTGVIDYSFSP